MPDDHERRRFTENLPWYLNGTLADDERAWIDAYLRAHPPAMQEIEVVRLLQKEIAATVAERASDAGLDDLSARIRRSGSMRRPWWQLANDFLATLSLSPALTAGLILAQAGLIGFLAMERNRTSDELMGLTRSAGPAVLAGPVLRVNFKRETKEVDIRRLLIRTGCRIVGGPGQLGGYFVTASPSRFRQAIAELRASPWVESAEVLPSMPEQQE